MYLRANLIYYQVQTESKYNYFINHSKLKGQKQSRLPIHYGTQLMSSFVLLLQNCDIGMFFYKIKLFVIWIATAFEQDVTICKQPKTRASAYTKSYLFSSTSVLSELCLDGSFREAIGKWILESLKFFKSRKEILCWYLRRETFGLLSSYLKQFFVCFAVRSH